MLGKCHAGISVERSWRIHHHFAMAWMQSWRKSIAERVPNW